MTQYRVVVWRIDNVIENDRSYQRVADTGNARDKGPVYEYVPFQKEVREETQMFNQTLDAIDLPLLVKTINP